eukprot:CAMPEP_0194212856 /NCGR_PEP_ID=MMETSP0156-20130528/12982_1 /TAXON_ID=33649 /ORGANISM="Thalassionema nitzschioides, Strain L26-B" /LENGTH=718 /DNA_ID=CAMNT_0038940749 /DNA_START=64 /DNA_END=2217 /DNA_ORIENTATION=+
MRRNFDSALALLTIIQLSVLVKAFVSPNAFHNYNRARALLSPRGVKSSSSSPEKRNSLFDYFKGKKHKSSAINGSFSLIPPPENSAFLSSEEMKLNNNSTSNHRNNDVIEKLHNQPLMITNQTQSHDVASSSSQKLSNIFFKYFKGRKQNSSKHGSSLKEQTIAPHGTFLTSEEMKLKNISSSNLQNKSDTEKLHNSSMLMTNQTIPDVKNVSNNQEALENRTNFKFFNSWAEEKTERYKPFELLKAASALKQISTNVTRNMNSNDNKNDAAGKPHINSSMWLSNQTKPMKNEREMNSLNLRRENTFKFFDSWKAKPQQFNQQFEFLKTEENSTKADTFITKADLKEFLRSNGYVKKIDSKIKPTTTTKTEGKSTSVAFPQPNPVTYRDLIISTAISSALIGIIVGGTISSNLWLVGGLFLGCWGYQIARNYENAPPTNVLSELLVSVGRRLAELYHSLYFSINGLWFMYKTGQLSYVYWKQYAQLDDRFAITTKMDSWNEKFQEGKQNFDKWEQDNEIGRKVLAGLRLVAYNKQGKRWRMTQYYQRLRESIESRLQGSGEEFTAVLKGMRRAIAQQRLDELFPRALAALEAWVLLNLVGALFAIAPSLLGCLSVTVGLVWPTWTQELRQRFSRLVKELSQQGRLESSAIKEIGKQRFYDKTRYHYFTRADGTRRWYRTGQSTKVVGNTKIGKKWKGKQNQRSWWPQSKPRLENSAQT